MKRTSTDQLLTLGMALYADKRTMEQRMRGIFGTKRSAPLGRILAVVLAAVLGLLCFTTACLPGPSPETGGEGGSASAAGGVTDAPVADNAAPATATPGAEAFMAGVPENAVQSFLAGLAETAFVPMEEPERIVRGAAEIAPGVTLSFNAAVTVPETDGCGVRRAEKRVLTDAEYMDLIDVFLPGADWRVPDVSTATVSETPFDIRTAKDGESFRAIAEQGGETYRISGRRGGDIFEFQRTMGYVYREGFLIGDWEMERDFGETIREPIALTREAAQKTADAALSALGVTGLALYGADRACLFGEGADGEMPVLSRGWDFVYRQADGGLTVPYHGGKSGGPNDPLAYEGADEEWIWLYVDDTGVSRFYWNAMYAPAETLYENVPILGAEAAAELTAKRLTRKFVHLTAEDGAVVTIEVADLRLCAAAISDAAGDPSGKPMAAGTTCLLVPAWEAACIIRYGGEAATGFDIEYCFLPFSAVDGGALAERSN